MIPNDNGPPDGDYVRYIEGLLARASSTLPTSTKPQGELPHDRIADHAMHGAPQATPLPATSQRPLDPTAANEVARALMTRTSVTDTAPKVAIGFQRLVGAAGLALVLYGLFGKDFNLLYVLMGAALINWFIRLRKRT